MDWGAIATISISAVVLILAVIFRKEIRKIVDKLVLVKSISKDGSNLSAEFEGEPTEEHTIKMQSDIARNKTDNVDTEWYDLFLNEEYEKSYELLIEVAKNSNSENDRVQNEAMAFNILSRYNYEEAMFKFDNLIKSNEYYAIPYIQKSFAQSNIGDYDGVVSTLNEGIKRSNEKDRVILVLADYYISLEKQDDALETIHCNIEVTDYTSDIYMKIAEIKQINNTDEALNILFEAQKKRKLSDFHSIELAKMLDNNGMKKEALYLLSTLSSREHKSTVLTLMGNLYLELQLNDLALTSYLEALDLTDEKEGWILANIGNLYNNKGLYSMAQEYLNKALEISNGDEYTLKRLASVVENLNIDNRKRNEYITEGKRAFLSESFQLIE